MRPLLPFIILTSIALVHCKAPAQSGMQSVTESILGKQVEWLWNTDSTYVIARQSAPGASGLIHFLVINTRQSIVNRGQFRPGYIKWIDAHTIEYQDLPGMIREEDSSQYIKRITIQKN